MKHSSYLLLGALAVSALPSAPAHADLEASYYRCTFDQLTSSSAAKQRRQWAQTWAKNDPYGLSSGSDWRFWDSSYTVESSEASASGLELYPVYYDPTTGSAYNMPDDIVYTNGTTLTTYAVKPQSVMMDGLCAPGCYEGFTLIQQGDEATPIEEAYALKSTALTTLAPISTFDRLAFMQNRVGAYSVDYAPALQDMLSFTTTSGVELNVTLNHPIVAEDGTLREARDFRLGDAFILASGELDPITDIVSYQMFGLAYNLKPITKDLRSNILIAEGVLNGSLRYQNEYADELNRVILRSSFPEAYLP